MATLVGPRQPHGTLEVLRVVQLDVDADVVREATREQLRLLQRLETPCMSHASLERVLIRLDGRGEWQACQVREVVGGDRQPKVFVAEALELLPLWHARVALVVDVPLLRGAGQPDSVDEARLLGTEEGLALV